MCRKTLLSLCAVLPLAALLAALPGAAAEKVVLRTAGGRFLHAAEDGTLRAESFVPGDKETFALVSRGKQQIALKGPGGRWLVPDARDGRTPRLGGAAAEPGDRETFQLVPAGANRFALRGHGSSALLVFDPADARPPDPRRPPARRLRETVEIYRVRELPAILQTALPAALHALAAEELAGKQYDKTQTHKTEKYVDLPDPTLKDLKRTKRHKVISVTEEYRVQAQLDGQADVRIPAMLFLGQLCEGRPGRDPAGSRCPAAGSRPRAVQAARRGQRLDRLSRRDPAFGGRRGAGAAFGRRREVQPAGGARSARVVFAHGFFQRPAEGRPPSDQATW